MFKKFIPLLFLSTLLGTASVQAQITSFGITGNPANTSGWNLTNDCTVNGTDVVLTPGATNKLGQIYYTTPKNIARCSQFTVTFDFRMDLNSQSPSDGLAFWVINGSPTFTPPQTIGLPYKPDGLLLVFDTYDWNNGQPSSSDNPRISLRHLNGTSYVEKSTTGLLAPDEINQDFLVDGQWHTCELKYSFGTVTVRFDNKAPLMVGNSNLSLSNAYFGFSAGTSATNASRHSIKNVNIAMRSDIADPPTADTVFICQYQQAQPLVGYPNTNLRWYTTPTGGTALSSAPIPNTDTPGTYVWYAERDIPTCNITSRRGPVYVKVIPSPKTPVVDIPVYCSGQVGIAIQNPIVGSKNSITWYDSLDSKTGTPNPPRPSTNVAKTYQYYIAQMDSITGCESKRGLVVVDIHQSPEVDFDWDISYACKGGDTVYFHNLTNYANKYFWQFGVANATSTAKDPVYHYRDEGTYFVNLIVQNDFCVDSVIKNFALGHPLAADFTQSADTICQGTRVNFESHSTSTVINGVQPKLNFFFGDNTSSNLEKPSYVFGKAGVYKISLVIQNGIPCYDTAIKYIVVDSLSPIFIRTLDTPICQGELVTFTSDYASSGLISSYWNFGDGKDSVYDFSPISHAFDKAGKFNVSISNKYRACPDSSIAVAVRVKPMPYLNLGEDTSVCLNGDIIVLKDAINEKNKKAEWMWSTGDTTSSVSITQPGKYWAKVTIDNCSTYDEINIDKDCYLDVPNTFTPNGDGHNDYFLPRQLLSKGASAFSMTVFNRWGQKVYESTTVNGRGWDGRFNGKDQPVGVYVYMIDVVFKNGRTESYKGNITLLR